MNESVKRKTLEYIRQHDFVTYARLQRFFIGIGYDYIGEYCTGSGENNLFWINWSEEAHRMLSDLVDAGLVSMVTTYDVFYWADHAILDYPLGELDCDYKELHWTPVCFRPIPAPPYEDVLNERLPEAIAKTRALGDKADQLLTILGGVLSIGEVPCQ